MWRGLKRALTDPKPLPRVVHILPYGVMWARTGLWDQLVRAADVIPGAAVRRSEMAIKLPNGGTYQCGGCDNPDSWRGGAADEAVIDEADDTPPSLVPLVIEPMLADRNGTLVLSGTPAVVCCRKPMIVPASCQVIRRICWITQRPARCQMR